MNTRLTQLCSSGLCGLLLAPALSVSADSLQTLYNEVADGDIVVDFLAEGDRRLDWATIPSYSPADVDEVTPLLSIETISIAHDSTNFYFRIQLDSAADPLVDPSQSYFSSHHAIFIDTDQDRSSGYIGDDGDPLLTDGFLSIGAEYLIEGPALFSFGNFLNPPGPTQDQEAYTFGTQIAFGSVNYDDDPVTDIEFEIPRATMGNPEVFDFVVLTTNEDFSDQDQYPNDIFSASEGEFFTYSTVPVATTVEGDYNADGFVSQADLDLVLLNWGSTTVPAGLDEAAIPGGGPFDSLMSQNELDGVLLNWGSGTAPDLSAIPEPTSLLATLGLGGLLLNRRRRQST